MRRRPSPVLAPRAPHVGVAADARPMDLARLHPSPPRPRAALLGLGLFVVWLFVSTTTPAAGSETDPVGVWPLDPPPEVVAGFDPPDAPWGSGHRGVDLRGHPGQVVHASLAGKITFAGSI